jgi:hypothetical protein
VQKDAGHLGQQGGRQVKNILRTDFKNPIIGPQIKI